MTLKKLRIVIGGLDVGGAERHLSYVLPELAKRGWDIHILTLSQRCQLREVFEAQGIKITLPKKVNSSSLPNPLYRGLQLFYAAYSLYKDFRLEPNTLTHFFLPEAYIIGGTVASISRLKGKRVMSRRCLNFYQKKYPLIKSFETWLHKKNDLNLANSQKIVGQLIDEGAAKERVKLIYNGIPLNSFPPTTSNKTTIDVSNKDFVMLIVANLIPYKGHSDLLKALSICKDGLPKNWCLLVAGRDDGIGSSLKEEAIQLGVDGNIQWLGSAQDVPSLLEAANLSLLCSHEEGFSNAILEAMLKKKPLVVTDVGGNAEAVEHEQTGLVVPPHNPEELSKAILTLANDPNKRKKYGQAGYKRAIEHFELEQCVENYENTYLTLLDDKGSDK